MTVDRPLTCYVCGVTSDEFVTVDRIGCLKSGLADKRFFEKFGREPESYLFICDKCKKKNKSYAKNIEKKYGVFE